MPVQLFPGVNWNLYWDAVIFAMVETRSEDVSGPGVTCMLWKILCENEVIFCFCPELCLVRWISGIHEGGEAWANVL